MHATLQSLAPSGLAIMPDLAWGSHVGHLFSEGDQLRDVLVPYFKAGLENNERCLWVTDAPLKASDARRALALVVPDLHERERRGQIEIEDGANFYDRTNPFRAEEVIGGLLQRELAALAEGYSGLRTNGNCAWVDHGDWPEFRHYETLVQSELPGRRLICMCSYHKTKLRGDHLVDVLDRHDIVLGRETPATNQKADDANPPALANHDFQSDLDAIEAIAAVPLLLKIVCQTTGMGFSAIARVTGDRWVCLGSHDEIGFGLTAGGELPVESTLCNEIFQSHEAVVINHVARDALYSDHHTPATYGLQSYISVPIILRGGGFYGTLCAIDPDPAELDTPEVIGMFRAFADLIAFHLEAQSRLAMAEANLLDAHTTVELHDQFVAVLRHDLRNPIAAIAAGAHLLTRTELDEKFAIIVDGISKSAARMAALVDDVIDLAKGRLGTGLTLKKSHDRLRPALRHIVQEMRLSYPDRTIRAAIKIDRLVECDADYVARALSNLLSNALKYGAPDRPVRVTASANDNDFTLSVSNAGAAIRPEVLDRLFAPFERGDVRPEQQGLGLGLYIVAEIAKAHGGGVEVTSTDDETKFTLRLPLTS